MNLHTDLLAQARHLATKEPRRPRQASLRRAVSASYYAVFHLLIDAATRRLVTGPDRSGLRTCLGRAFSHSGMKAAAIAFREAPLPKRIAPALAKALPQPPLRAIAQAFVTLQQARHEADYDTGRRFGRQATLDFAEVATQAFHDWRAVRGTLPADAFLVSLLAYASMRA